MPTISEALPLSHWPRVFTLTGGQLIRVTRCDAVDIAFDRVIANGTDGEGNPQYAVQFPAQAVPPIAGFDPATAEAWPTDAALIAHLDAHLFPS